MSAASEARANGWVQQERGWWTKQGVGGVCREGRWWFCYPEDGTSWDGHRVGGFETMEFAMEVIDPRPLSDSQNLAPSAPLSGTEQNEP